MTMRNLILYEACNAMCKGCRDKWPEADGYHTKQILKDKDEKGRYIYNPVMTECVAMPIKKLMAGGAWIKSY